VKATWREIEAEREPFYKAAERELTKAFEATFERMDSALILATPETIEGKLLNAIDESEGDYVAAYAAFQGPVVEHYALAEYRKWSDAKAEKPAWLIKLLARVLEFAGGRITLVQETTKEMVRHVVTGPIMEEALNEGWGIDKIVRALRPELQEKVVEYAKDWRVERIARTEIIGSSNFSTMQAAGQAATDFDLELVKEWISTHDGRTRDSHASMDGTIEELDKPFIVNGSLLEYPGDYNGAPGEVINCRCAVATVSRDLA